MIIKLKIIRPCEFSPLTGKIYVLFKILPSLIRFFRIRPTVGKIYMIFGHKVIRPSTIRHFRIRLTDVSRRNLHTFRLSELSLIDLLFDFFEFDLRRFRFLDFSVYNSTFSSSQSKFTNLGNFRPCRIRLSNRKM